MLLSCFGSDVAPSNLPWDILTGEGLTLSSKFKLQGEPQLYQVYYSDTSYCGLLRNPIKSLVLVPNLLNQAILFGSNLFAFACPQITPLLVGNKFIIEHLRDRETNVHQTEGLMIRVHPEEFEVFSLLLLDSKTCNHE